MLSAGFRLVAKSTPAPALRKETLGAALRYSAQIKRAGFATDPRSTNPSSPKPPTSQKKKGPEPVTAENFFKKKTESQGSRMLPWLIGVGLPTAALGVVLLNKRRQHDSFKATFCDIGRLLDELYFDYNNPRLADAQPLLPSTPSAHFTVVVDLKDLLYVREGPGGKKRPQMRPYMDVFLEELSQRCELVIWSSMEDMQVIEWIEKLEKQSPCFHSVLYFTDCTLANGHVVKDLSRLNRPLENVILATSTPSHAAYQPRNALFLQSWDGSTSDTALLDTYVFLQYLVQNHNPVSSDVRLILRRFSSVDAAEANRSTRIKYHDKILQANHKTKAMLNELKRSAPGAQAQPLAGLLG